MNEYFDYFIKKNNNTHIPNDNIELIKSFIDTSSTFEYYYTFPINEREKLMEQFLEFYYNEIDYDYDNYDYSWIFNPILDNCYQLNTDSKLKVEKYKQNELQLHLYHNDYEKIIDITG